jgi:RNA polymerase sigma factor (sigma-70 family)
MKPVPIEILQNCQRKDRKAQYELFQLVHGFMLGLCKRYYTNKEDRSSIANAAFLKLLKSLENKIPDGSLEAWCRTITMNTVIDDFRKNKKRISMMTTNNETVGEDISEATYNEVNAKFEKEEFENLLHQLPEMTRYVFNLFAIEGYTHAEIASNLQIADGTSKWHVSEARRLLKIALEKSISKRA